jgi:mono/diheme cytochrome c family protein
MNIFPTLSKTWLGSTVFCLLASTIFCNAQKSSPSENPPSLEETRTIGRANSALLAKKQAITTANGKPSANLADFKKHISPILTKTCVQCHGPKKAKGKFRIDTLDPNLIEGGDIDWWLEVLDAVSNDEMPPEDAEVKLTGEETSKVTGWLSSEIQKASAKRRHEGGHSSFRRMARYEYDYALQDLLGLSYSLSENLPPETDSENGFKNSSEMLQMSAMQFETYREIALKALEHTTVVGEQPKAVVYQLPNSDEASSTLDRDQVSKTHILTQKTKKGQAPPETVIFDQRNRSVKFNLSNHLPDQGTMRITLRARRSTMKADEFASLRFIFSAHTSNNANFSEVISKRAIPVTGSLTEPQLIHLDIPLSEIQRNPFRNNKETFPRRDEFLTIECQSKTRGKEPLSITLDFIEISAPFFEQWPPQTHRDIFFESPNKNEEVEYAREVLTRFMERAWRRPVSLNEVAPFVTLFMKYRPEFSTMEEAMIEVLATVLATPEFLYITQEDSSIISETELAIRLSFFLWSSIPDKELRDLAKDGTLRDPEVLKAQITRMLADPRSARFSKHFVQQWLGLDGLKSVVHVTDSALMEAMQEEPIAFFQSVLKSNRSLMDFLHSDYALLNERMAEHYQIRNIYGPQFRKVSIEPNTNRGGILTNAAILTMNSDGKDSHPLKRGIWMLERILDDPPPPAPPNVPEVDLTNPKILEMTLKERIVDHRNKPACISCHAKIDPWGIAFENYDALGVYRTKIKNKPVDATSALFNKQELAGMEGLKRYLLAERQDQFARAMVHKITSYALGRALTFSDHAEIEALTVQFRKKEDRLSDLIHLIICSSIFNSK